MHYCLSVSRTHKHAGEGKTFAVRPYPATVTCRAEGALPMVSLEGLNLECNVHARVRAFPTTLCVFNHTDILLLLQEGGLLLRKTNKKCPSHTHKNDNDPVRDSGSPLPLLGLAKKKKTINHAKNLHTPSRGSYRQGRAIERRFGSFMIGILFAT